MKLDRWYRAWPKRSTSRSRHDAAAGCSTTARLRTRCLALALPAALAVAAVTTRLPAEATENGLNAYPTGVNTVLPALDPPPGKTEFYDYTQYYEAGKTVDSSGKSAVPDFHLSVFVEAVRILHTHRFSAGHFTFSSGVVQPIVNISLRAAGHGQSASGLGDTTLQPLFANYVSPDHKVFAYLGPVIFVPTGSYSVRNLANTGLNYVTYSPNASITWFPNPKIQTSLQLIQEIHTTNQANGYHSGASVAADYAIDYAPFAQLPKIHTALQGYFFQQTGDDTLQGHIFRGGNRGRTVGIGPQIRYDLPGGGIALKYQHEFAVQNRAQGDRYWLQFALPL